MVEDTADAPPVDLHHTVNGFVIEDCETTALHDNGKPADDAQAGRLAAVAWLRFDRDWNFEGEEIHYVLPAGWSMDASPEAQNVNHLTDEFLRTYGKPVAQVLARFEYLILIERRPVIAHNAQFDCKTIRGERRRLDLDDLFHQTVNYCTMRASRKYVGPRCNLGACMRYFGVIQRGTMHNAINDAWGCAGVLQGLKPVELEMIAHVHHAREGGKAHQALMARGK